MQTRASWARVEPSTRMFAGAVGSYGQICAVTRTEPAFPPTKPNRGRPRDGASRPVDRVTVRARHHNRRWRRTDRLNSPARSPMRRRHGHPDDRRRKAADGPGATAQAGAVPAHEPRRDGCARLGRLRHRAGDGRCLCRPSELRHGDHRPAARGAGLPGRHHRAAGLALGRAVQGTRQAEGLLRRHRRQHGLHGEPLHRRPPPPPATTPTRPAAKAASGRTAAPSSTPSAAARRSRTPRSCSAASRPRCAGSRITTTGPTRCAARCSPTPRRTCCSTAMPSAPWSRSPTASPPARRPASSTTSGASRCSARSLPITRSCTPTISIPPTRAHRANADQP
ncbi:hypothetical protein ABIA44_007993 [Bradyrhizobium sp. USDA 329]